VPVVVLSGEFDSLTTPEEGALIASAFPVARQVIVANSFHVTAVGDADDCAVRIVRQFVRHPRTGLTARRLSCANEVPPLRAVTNYHRSYRKGAPARALPGSHAGARALDASAGAVRTTGDLIDRWWNNWSGIGHGLHGGKWWYTGDKVARFRLKKMRLHRNLAVSGRVTWDRYGHSVVASLDIRRVRPNGRVVRGSPVNGHLEMHWDSRALGAKAFIRGTLGGHAVVARMRAP
jgi:hypothetical protein